MSHTLSIKLTYFALMREQRGVGEECLTINAGSARDLYNELSTRYNFTLPADRVGVAINQKFCPMDQPLNDNDVVVFIPPVAGG